MGPAPQWFALAAAVTVLNGAVLGFLAWRERHRVLWFWAAGWLTWALAVLPMSFLESSQTQSSLPVALGCLWVASSLCFLAGAYALTERRLPRAWLGVAGGCVVIALIFGVGPYGKLGMVPLVLFQSTGLAATGVRIVRTARRRAGAWLSGVAMVLLALHLLDAPALSRAPELFLWGLVLAIALEVVAALGMITLYYEHAREAFAEAQRALGETKRIEALGRVAGGVAHDFNNMLTVMRGHIELMRMHEPQNQDAEASLQAMDRAVDHASRLTAQLLSFGRRSALAPRRIDVREVVKSTVELLSVVTRPNVRIVLEVADGDYAASMDRALLEQIVLNLITNARDAITGAGTINVSLASKSASATSVVLRVRDDGEGMDAEVLRHIFEPFFTTKAAGRGTGLGLAAVQGSVSQLGGTIQVESLPGKGTTFEVILPIERAEAADAAPSAPVRLGALRVLVVDDDAEVRGITAKMLELGGHRVDQVEDVDGALERLDAQPYDVVLTDVVMPRSSGLVLRSEVGERWPDLVVVLTSAYPPEAVSAGLPVVPKPFDSAMLLRMLGDLVAEHRRGRAN